MRIIIFDIFDNIHKIFDKPIKKNYIINIVFIVIAFIVFSYGNLFFMKKKNKNFFN